MYTLGRKHEKTTWTALWNSHISSLAVRTLGRWHHERDRGIRSDITWDLIESIAVLLSTAAVAVAILLAHEAAARLLAVGIVARRPPLAHLRARRPQRWPAAPTEGRKAAPEGVDSWRMAPARHASTPARDGSIVTGRQTLFGASGGICYAHWPVDLGEVERIRRARVRRVAQRVSLGEGDVALARARRWRRDLAVAARQTRDGGLGGDRAAPVVAQLLEVGRGERLRARRRETGGARARGQTSAGERTVLRGWIRCQRAPYCTRGLLGPSR